MPTQQIISTVYEITSSGPNDDSQNLYIKVEISKGSAALSGATEAQILGFVKSYLQSLSPNPINVGRVQVVRVDGL
jgi:hypothetical protein